MGPVINDQVKIRALPWCLAHGVLTSIFVLWTFGGSAFVLFLRELGLPMGQIGILLSLFPFCGLIALGFAPVAARMGRKLTVLACYGSRNLVMALLLALPWVVSVHGRSAAILFLSGVIVVFAVLRALAETAWYPWVQEFIPNHVRGKFAAWSAVLSMIASGLALAVASHVLGLGEGLGRYLFLIGAGSLLGVIGAILLIKVPGGAPEPKAAATSSHGANMAAALHDRNFRFYLAGMAGQTIGLAMLVSFLPLYMRDQIGLRAATIVRLDIVAMAGGALASLGCGWLSDRLGSRPVLMPTAALLALIPLGWLLLPRHAAHVLAGASVLYFIFGAATNGTAIGAGRLLYNGVVPPEKSTAYMAIYYAWMGVTGGIAPLLAGGILSAASDRSTTRFGMPIDGYAVMFATALFCLVSGWAIYGRVRPDGRYTTRTAVRSFMTRIAQR